MEKALLPFVVSASLLCSGCTHHVKDLEFVALEVPDNRLANSSHSTWLTPSGATVPLSAREARLPSGADNLLIRFRTHENLTQFKSAGDYVRVSPCPYREEPYVGISEIFAGGYRLGELRLSTGQIESKVWVRGKYAGAVRYDGPSGVKPVNGFYYYEGVFPAKNLNHFDNATHTIAQAFLPADVQDWCFKIVGPQMPVPAYESNEARIPSKILVAAFRKR